MSGTINFAKNIFLAQFRIVQNFHYFCKSKKIIFDRSSTGADLTKIVKFLYYHNLCLENIFCKIICSLHQKKCFSIILGNFWKIEF